MTFMPRLLLLAAPAVLAVLPAAAQVTQTPTNVQGQPLRQPIYKCGAARYTQAPCEGGKELGTRVSRTYDRNIPPPQDRARQMARAQLPPEEREKCGVLEHQIRTEESRLRTKAGPPTEAEEGNLAIQRVHYREMRC